MTEKKEIVSSETRGNQRSVKNSGWVTNILRVRTESDRNSATLAPIPGGRQTLQCQWLRCVHLCVHCVCGCSECSVSLHESKAKDKCEINVSVLCFHTVSHSKHNKVNNAPVRHRQRQNPLRSQLVPTWTDLHLPVLTCYWEWLSVVAVVVVVFVEFGQVA